MSRIWVQTLTVTVIAVVAAHTISYGVRSIVGKPADHVTLVLATILPILIAIPIALFVFRQGERLNLAHAALLAANEALVRKASHDQMTGLLNRASFLEQVDLLRLMPQSGVLLIIDADHFKRINDRYGHPVGDKALIRISAAIAGAVRKEDIVGRVGGEEFGAFLLGADLHEATLVAQRLRDAVAATEFVVFPDERVSLTVSVGGANARPASLLADLVQRADGCLYEAKRRGRNLVVIEGGSGPVA